MYVIERDAVLITSWFDAKLQFCPPGTYICFMKFCVGSVYNVAFAIVCRIQRTGLTRPRLSWHDLVQVDIYLRYFEVSYESRDGTVG